MFYQKTWSVPYFLFSLAVIAALNQVQWNVRQDHTRATWHGALRIVIDGEAYHQ